MFKIEIESSLESVLETHDAVIIWGSVNKHVPPEKKLVYARLVS